MQEKPKHYQAKPLPSRFQKHPVLMSAQVAYRYKGPEAEQHGLILFHDGVNYRILLLMAAGLDSPWVSVEVRLDVAKWARAVEEFGAEALRYNVHSMTKGHPR